jgi:hypothetical protein
MVFEKFLKIWPENSSFIKTWQEKKSFQVYDLKHWSMECYKVVAVHASIFKVDGEERRRFTRSIVAPSPCAACITWYDVTACRGHILHLTLTSHLTRPWQDHSRIAFHVNNAYFTWSPMYICGNAALNSSSNEKCYRKNCTENQNTRFMLNNFLTWNVIWLGAKRSRS